MSAVAVYPSPDEARRLAKKFSSPMPRREPVDPRRKTLGEWKAEVAAREGVSVHAIESRLHRGKMKYPRIEKKNERVLYVLGDEEPTGTTG